MRPTGKIFNSSKQGPILPFAASAFYIMPLGLLSLAFIGCSDPPQFRQNAVEIRKQEVMLQLDEGESYPPEQLEDIGTLLTAMFGTPDEPRFPLEYSDDFIDLIPEDEPLVTQERLELAAGPVFSGEDGKGRGLYREHCVHCHGISGDGAGPTAAFLNPYPRDFRLGVFKFKSTEGAEKPTREDLRRTLTQGIPGTSMSSFHLLDEEEMEALIDYVIYLSVRGQAERALLRDIPEFFDPTDDILNPQNEDQDEYIDNLYSGVEIATAGILDAWVRAQDKVTEFDARPESLDYANSERPEMVARGRELFMSASSGNCFSCHGYTALGDGVVDNLDDWTKDWVEGAKVDIDDEESLNEFIELGALTPRPSIPRNLRQGVYRGGSRPTDLFLRIKNGIAGSPMPAAAANMTDEDIWCIVEYVRSLPYEDLSEPAKELKLNSKETF